jgi:uncharacterized NAD-dependent epimerase/dehydratase family protein
MKKSTAIILTNGMLDTMNAKTCHGLLRGTERFEVLSVIDYKHAGKDAGEIMDGRALDIPIYASVKDHLAAHSVKPQYYVVGVALEGGLLPDDFRAELLMGMEAGISIVCGLHTLLSEDAEFSEKAKQNGVELIDVRKPRKFNELRFWTGEIFQVSTPKVAVLGTDCAIGKRTTCRFLMEACQANGIKAEMIYTGQTGWMQGYKHGFIFDSTLNDFISGEIEGAILAADKEENPDLILVEGQSSLQNPSGPCGMEFLISGNVKGVVLQHKPARKYFDGNEAWGPIPSLKREIKLIELFGAKVLAITLNEGGMSEKAIIEFQAKTEKELNIPVTRPLSEGMGRVLEAVKHFMEPV